MEENNDKSSFSETAMYIFLLLVVPLHLFGFVGVLAYSIETGEFPF